MSYPRRRPCVVAVDLIIWMGNPQDFYARWRACRVRARARAYVCSGSLIWLFYLAFDPVKLILPCQEVGFTCPFVVIDPTDLGATTAVDRNLLQD